MRARIAPFLTLTAVLLGPAATGCASLADDLRQAQDAYEQARYENAISGLVR